MAKWTDEKIAQMWELLKNNSVTQTAKLMGISRSSINQKKFFFQNVKSGTRADNENKVKIPCLSCGNVFLSKCKINNRRCLICKRKDGE